MASVRLRLSSMAFACLCFYGLVSLSLCAGVLDSILDNAEPCKESCHATYGTPDQKDVKHDDCCKRGCRFYSLVELIHAGQDENATMNACTASCMEAYVQTDDRYACNTGCSKQVPHAVQKPSADEQSSSVTATPFLYVHNVYNNMMDHMCRMMSISWSLYVQQDDGKVVLVQSDPEIIAEYLDMDDVENSRLFLSDKIKEDEATEDVAENSAVVDGGGTSATLLSESTSDMKKASSAVVSGEDSKNSPDIYYYATLGQGESASGGYFIPVGIEVSVSRAVDGRSQQQQQEPSSSTSSVSTSSADWLGCVSRKSGLPRWLLGLIIFLSAVVMVWLCFATSVTSSEHHLKPKVVSIYGDIEYLKSSCPIKEKVFLAGENGGYSDDEILQAEPLPTKEDLKQQLV